MAVDPMRRQPLKPNAILSWDGAPDEYYRVISGPNTDTGEYVVELIDATHQSCGQTYEDRCNGELRTIRAKVEVDRILADYAAWRLKQ